MTHIIQLITAHRFEEAVQALAADPTLIAATALNLPEREGIFHYAACSENIDFMKHLIGLGGDFDRAPAGACYMTPLSEAARVGSTAMIVLLQSNGARVDGSDSSALSPLMVAAKAAKPDSVDLLLKYGANPNRLGFLQRYLPVDFAGWQDSEECRKLIRAAKGLSVTDDYDWRSQSGYPIITTVSNQIGAVFPLQLSTLLHKTSIRVAQVRKSPRYMYVFTDELHAYGRTELAFFLSPSWGILSNYQDGASQQSFPIDVLRALGALVAKGQLRVEEGSVFECSCSPLSDLKWPNGVGALAAVNHQFVESGVNVGAPVDKADCVEILVLVPLPAGGTWSKGQTQLKKVLESMRKARLQKITLVDPLFAAS